MIVVVDTSVWVAHFSGRDPTIGHRLLASAVMVHDFTVGELVLGVLPRSRRVPEEIGAMGRVPALPHSVVLEFVIQHRLQEMGIGWVDAHVLASTASAGARLWTLDKAFAAAAVRAGVPA
jgi:predicted nucleic acid-binding protein